MDSKTAFLLRERLLSEDLNGPSYPENKKKTTPWYAYLILVLCGASGAMDGPFS